MNGLIDEIGLLEYLEKQMAHYDRVSANWFYLKGDKPQAVKYGEMAQVCRDLWHKIRNGDFAPVLHPDEERP